jgi:hypothetical protein
VIKGAYFFKPDQELVMIMVVDTEGRVHNEFEPTEVDIERICEEYNFNFGKTMEMIRNKAPDVHTLIIDAKVYREASADE